MTAPTTEERRESDRRVSKEVHIWGGQRKDGSKFSRGTADDRRATERERAQKELSPDVMDAWRWREGGERDALRYRWMRSNVHFIGPNARPVWPFAIKAGDMPSLDAAIDAEILKGAKS